VTFLALFKREAPPIVFVAEGQDTCSKIIPQRQPSSGYDSEL